VILFGSSAPASLAAELRALEVSAPGGISPLVMTDEEGGVVQRMANLVGSIPSARQMAATMSSTRIFQLAKTLGQRMRAAGVTMDLAPVLDLDNGQGPNNLNPDGTRSFSLDPGVASADGSAFMEGLRAGGIVPAIKHFPGLGRVVGNTDFTASVVDEATASDDPYLGPFQQAIAAGADLVMVSTATYEKIDPRHLAVFSPVIMSLLRDTLHFDGVIVEDNLGSAVSVATIAPGDRAVDFIAAGGDLVTVKTANLAGPMVGAILKRAAADPAFARQVDAAVMKVLELKIHARLAGCGA
jgi:beta-N-acetylhexosaminidase